jgi:hypothetical protein
MKKSLLCIFLITLFGCSEGSLGDGYFYLPEYDAMDTGYPYGSVVYKSTQKNIFQQLIIRADVISCTVKGHYILVVQKPNKALMKKEIIESLDLWNNYTERIKDSLVTVGNTKIDLSQVHTIKLAGDTAANKFADSLINVSGVSRQPINYYIIDKKVGLVNGPLTKSEFEKIKANL